MLEQVPVGRIHFPPRNGEGHRVKSEQSWESIAKMYFIDTWELIEFNFPVIKTEPNFQTKCRMVNWLLQRYVGCTQTRDGKNYCFDSFDNPGYIYIPVLRATTSHRIKLHFRALSLTNVAFQTVFENIQSVYKQYGIRADFGSGQSLNLPEEQAERLAIVDGKCDWEITTGELAEVQGLAGHLPKNDILVCFVHRFPAEANRTGCGGHAPNRPACIVAADGGPYSTAHEIGHVLLGADFLPMHETNTRNLMYEYASKTTELPILYPAQVAQMKKSPCCIPI